MRAGGGAVTNPPTLLSVLEKVGQDDLGVPLASGCMMQMLKGSGPDPR